MPPEIDTGPAFPAPGSTIGETSHEIAEFRELLLSGLQWNYRDEGWPESVVNFKQNGRFHKRWRWFYWIKSDRSLHVQYWENGYDPDKGVVFEFNDALDRFTCRFSDPDGRVHRITGTRLP